MLEAEGIPPTASTASVGLGLQWAGDRCFAYSGTFNINTTAFTMLEWNSGALTIIGTFYGYGPIKFDSAGLNSGQFGGFQVSLNGEVVAIMKADTSQHDMGQVMQFTAVIPPFTTVLVEGLGYATTAGFLMECNFTGRVYDA